MEEEREQSAVFPGKRMHLEERGIVCKILNPTVTGSPLLCGALWSAAFLAAFGPSLLNVLSLHPERPSESAVHLAKWFLNICINFINIYI